jgi:hypothetical protein
MRKNLKLGSTLVAGNANEVMVAPMVDSLASVV